MLLADMRRGCHQGGAAGDRRRVPVLRRDAVRAHVPGLQPEQAVDHDRQPRRRGPGHARRPDPHRGRVPPQLPARCRRAAARRLRPAPRGQPATGLLRDQRSRRRWPVCLPSVVRHRRPGLQRHAVADPRPEPAADQRARGGRCGDRSLRRAGCARRAGAARCRRAGAPGGDLHARGDDPLPAGAVLLLLRHRHQPRPLRPGGALAELRDALRGRQPGGPAPVLAAEVLARPARGDRPQGPGSRRAVRRPPAPGPAPRGAARRAAGGVHEAAARGVARAAGAVRRTARPGPRAR